MKHVYANALESFRSQPRWVRIFTYVLFVGLAIASLDSLGDFYHGFSKGLAAGLHAANQ